MTANMNMAELAALEERYAGGTTARRGDVVMARGEGCWLWDVDGQQLSGHDVRAGRGDARPLPSVAERGHCRTGVTPHRLPQLLLQRRPRAVRRPGSRACLPEHLPYVFLANSGAEAIEAAHQVRPTWHGSTRHRVDHAQLSWHAPSARFR